MNIADEFYGLRNYYELSRETCGGNDSSLAA